MDHVLLTRFDLPSRGPESLIRAKEGWFLRRVQQLLEEDERLDGRQQTVSGFHWIVYFDPESPPLVARSSSAACRFLGLHAELPGGAVLLPGRCGCMPAHRRSGQSAHHHEP